MKKYKINQLYLQTIIIVISFSLIGFMLYNIFSHEQIMEENIIITNKTDDLNIVSQLFNLDKLSVEQQTILENNLIKNNAEIFKFNLASKENPIVDLSEIISLGYEQEKNILPIVIRLSLKIAETFTQELLQDKIIFPESAIRLNSNYEPYPFIITEFIETGIDKEGFIKKLSHNINELNKNLPRNSKVKLNNENSFIYLSHNNIISHIIRFEPRQEKLLSIKNFQENNTYFTLIIDDVGENYTLAKKFMELPFPVVFSILPNTLYATKTATIAHEKGFPVFLHQPMEAISEATLKEERTLLTNMSEEKIYNVLQKNMILVPNIRGINNHTGSKFTTNKTSVNYFVSAMKKLAPHILILDSFTTKNSVLYDTAKKENFLTATRDYFIDDDNKKTLKVLQESYNYAKSRGQAYVIGHARTSTLNALKAWKDYQDTDLIFCLPSH